jgi:hypothetical protein
LHLLYLIITIPSIVIYQIEKKKTSAKSTELQVIDQISHHSNSPNHHHQASNTISTSTDGERNSGIVSDSAQQQQQRRKHKAKSSNPLSTMKAQQV